MTELSALDRHDFEVGRPLDFLPYYWDRPADFTGKKSGAQTCNRGLREHNACKAWCYKACCTSISQARQLN